MVGRGLEALSCRATISSSFLCGSSSSRPTGNEARLKAEHTHTHDRITTTQTGVRVSRGFLFVFRSWVYAPGDSLKVSEKDAVIGHAGCAIEYARSRRARHPLHAHHQKLLTAMAAGAPITRRAITDVLLGHVCMTQSKTTNDVAKKATCASKVLSSGGTPLRSAPGKLCGALRSNSSSKASLSTAKF